MIKNNDNLSDLLSFYQSAKNLCHIDNKENAAKFIELVADSTCSDKVIIIQNANEKLTIFKNEKNLNIQISQLIDVLPILYQSYACTRLKVDELADIISMFDLTDEVYLDCVFFSIEVSTEESLCFVMLNKEKYSEQDFQTVVKMANFLEEQINFSFFVDQGKELSEKLRRQQKRQSVWLESLAWLNEVSNKEYTNLELDELYKVALFQLKTLVRARSAVAFNVNSKTNQLESIISYGDDDFTDDIKKLINKTITIEKLSSGKCFNQNVLLFPLYIQKNLKMILCVGGKDSTFDEHEEIIASLFSDGLQHLIERMFFLREMKVQNTRLHKEKLEQEILIGKLQDAQEQLLQQEKMASIGQLAAGVAHEINNPVGYVNSNINSLESYITDLYQVLSVYEKIEPQLGAESEILTEIKALKSDIDYNFIKDDVKDLISESKEGVLRVKQIVKDLKDFSHVDEAEWQTTGIEKGIDSTLNIVRNELKYKANITKEYEEIPPITCVPSQINQVIMNLLVNAGHAIDDQGSITIKTSQKDQDFVYIEIADTGKGIEKEHLTKIFNPFFTTKPVGQGTGLGLSLSYSIAEKHGGELSVKSEIGVGTTFRLTLPIKQKGREIK